MSTDRLWSIFDRISEIPRCSGSEEKVREYIIEGAKRLGLIYSTDRTGNVLIRTRGIPKYCLQGHMDMVCVGEFPIRLREEDGWITADGSTLGADNGIGIAMMLALAGYSPGGAAPYG